MKSNLLALGGAVVGGIAGYALFVWLLKQGLLGLAIPGGILGLGAGIVKNKSILVAIICGVLATALGLFGAWSNLDVAGGDDFFVFLKHLGELKPLTLIMIGLGGFIGFWVPFRSRVRTSGSTAP